MKTAVSFYKSPVGLLKLVVEDEGVTALEFLLEDTQVPVEQKGTAQAENHLKKLITELTSYFAGHLKTFTVPVHFTQGTLFQQQVWRSLLTIPFGQTWSYKDLAASIDKPKAMRAVGNANGKNPIPIVVPCHRVIAHDGGLGGYSSGLDIKRKLLRLEIQ
jgi:methylated-DNA-[protein]-cysteine S-methyltransferase